MIKMTFLAHRAAHCGLAVLVLCGTLAIAPMARASDSEAFKKGVTAYEDRNYAEAFAHWTSIADKTDSKLATNLGVVLTTPAWDGFDPKSGMTWLNRGAEGGNKIAQGRLGWILLWGKFGIPADFEAAQSWLEAAAAQGSAQAMYDLGDLWILQNDDQKAFGYFQDAARAGFNRARTVVGRMYENGMGTEPNLKLAVSYYAKAVRHGRHRAARLALERLAEAGETGASMALADALLANDPTKTDVQTAIKWLGAAAVLGNKRATSKLSDLGRGGEEAATEMLRSAAESGQAYAMSNLYSVLAARNPSAPIEAEALSWLDRAIENGDQYSFLKKAELLEKGERVTGDLEEAVRLYARAGELEPRDQLALAALWRHALQGNAIAVAHFRDNASGNFDRSRMLASLYLRGIVESKDAADAVALLQANIADGDEASMVMLGALYFDGQAIGKNITRAKELFETAAKAGSAAANFNLGWMYENGNGVNIDMKRARKYYSIAEAIGYSRARDALERLDRARN